MRAACGFVWGRAVADVLLARRRGRRAPPSRCASRRVHCVPVLLQQRDAGTQPTIAALHAVYLQSAHLTLACARVSHSLQREELVVQDWCVLALAHTIVASPVVFLL